MAVSNWELQNSRLNGLLNKLTDEELATPTAPGRNTGVYILGHLIAVSDGLFTFLQVGERLHPELEELYLRNPEKSEHERPSLAALKNYLVEINALLDQKINSIQPDEWFMAHSAISAEDFAKEPFRNKLNILISFLNFICTRIRGPV